MSAERKPTLERLVETSRMLGSGIDRDPLLQALVDLACEVTQSEAASILLLEEETGLLKFVAAPAHQRRALLRVRVPLDGSVAGTAYTQGRPVTVKDAIENPHIYREVDQMLGFETRSLLAVPIRYGSQVLGVMEAVNKHGTLNYTGDDVTILETIADYAATALFNAALLEEASAAKQDIDALERMKADFIAVTSHELRTPLGLVLGHAALLKEELPEDPHGKQLDVILRSAERLQKILDDLTSVDAPHSGHGKLHWQVVDLGELLKTVCREFQVEARQKKIAMVVQCAAGNLDAEVDAEKIALAFGNLVENALRFTDPAGHVLALAEPLPGFIRISVLDDGVGIPARDLPHVFDRFFQVEAHTTRQHGGLGLGLSVAKVMVELHGGQIWAESIEGRGSKFSVLLPALPH
jgi:signal transduction histidine kinase